jgi:S1-C subfamily serine protease
MLLAVATVANADHGSATWDQASPSIVSVLPTWPGYEKPGFGAPDGIAPEGSGVVLQLEDEEQTSSLILTAAHVVDRATQVQIRSDKQQIKDAQILWVDQASDLALLKIDIHLPAIRLSETTPNPGSHVCALGNPFGLGISMSCGIISGPKRQNIGFNQIEDFLQTDAAVNPGSSGGALVDGTGDMVGMISAIFTKDADIDAGVNFAISNTLILERLAHFQNR